MCFSLKQKEEFFCAPLLQDPPREPRRAFPTCAPQNSSSAVLAASPCCCSEISSFFLFFFLFFFPRVLQGFEVLAEAATIQSLPGRSPPRMLRGWRFGRGVWLGAGAIQVGTRSVLGSGFGAAHPRDAHMAVGPSQISSSLCSIISRRMEYLCFSFFTSRSSSSSSFWMKLLRMGISNLMYWATS